MNEGAGLSLKAGLADPTRTGGNPVALYRSLSRSPPSRIISHPIAFGGLSTEL